MVGLVLENLAHFPHLFAQRGPLNKNNTAFRRKINQNFVKLQIRDFLFFGGAARRRMEKLTQDQLHNIISFVIFLSE